MPSTVTRADLTEAVFRKVGLSRQESAVMVDAVIEEICTALARDEEVKLSSFATFTVRSKVQREGRNPKTGEAATILPRKVVSFRPSASLKKHVLDKLRKAKNAKSALPR